MNSLKKLKISSSYWQICIAFFFLLFYFCYFYFRVDAKLVYQSQQPVFFFDGVFYREFLSYPGGLLELLSRFLAQFFYFTWSGALLLTGLMGLIALFGHILVRTLNPKQRLLFVPWMPTILVFILHHNYNHPLAVSLGFLIVLIASTLFIRYAPQRFIARMVIFAVTLAALYYATAGPALLFSLIVLCYDLLYQRRFLLPIIYTLLAVILPFLSSTRFFIIPLKKAYLMHLGFDVLEIQLWVLYILLSSIPLIMLTLFFLKKNAGKQAKNIFWEKLFYKDSGARLVVQCVGIFILLSLASWHFFQKEEKSLLLVDYAARNGKWQKVINEVQRGGLLDTYIGQYQLNRALYHTGRLCESMFVFPQRMQGDGLFLHKSVRHLYPLQYSDLFFELGLINEAQHWAHEALSVTGDTPWNLQRLAEVNILKKEYAVAGKCLRLLQKTMWHKEWADKRLAALEKTDFFAFPDIQHHRSLMLTTDFIVIPTRPEACLEELLAANDKNKMAFEYYMAGLLLDGKVGRFINRLDAIQNIHYQKMPRHFEQAVLLYMMNTGRRDFKPPGPNISQKSVQAFQNYINIVKKYNNPAAAYRELAATYGDTFWFYASYVYKKGK